MGNYLNPYIQGNYLGEEIIPWYKQNLYLQNLELTVSPIVTNTTESNIDNLKKSISFDLEGALALNNELEQQFIESTKNTPIKTEKLSWFSDLSDKFSILNKNIGQGFSKGIDILSNNQGLQNTAFGLANNFIQPVNNSSEVDSVFQVGDLVANMLPGKAGLITKGTMLGLKTINSMGGKKTIDFSVNQEAIAPTIGSYGGSSNLLEDAAAKAGLKYGLFSSSKRRKANAIIREAKKLQNIITDITQENEDLLAMKNDMNYSNYINNLNGGLGLNYYRIAKQGMKFKTLNRIKNLNFNTKILEDNNFIEYKEWTPTIITEEINFYQQGGSLNNKDTNRSIEQLITYAKEQNPRFIQRMSEPLRYVKVNYKDKEGKDIWGHSTHLMTHKGNKVFPLVLEDPKGQLFIIDDEDKALTWATLNNNVLTFDTEEEALNFQNNYKQGWTDFFNTSPLDINPEAEYEEYKPHKYKLLDLYSSVKEQFKEGGKLKEETVELKEETNQKNIIPEGALHKNKHHIENTDGLTLKGIPVVDNDGDQLAEIECNELILNLENTKFIEERYKKFYSNELTQKEKDQLAVEVGELLVQEILYNTDDRTGLIDKIV